MKKSIIALAVAGALTAPMVAQADATLYGSLRMKLNDLNANGELDVADNVSRIGIKGSTELFSGNKAIYQFEQGINTADGGAWGAGRLASIGITGDFGTAMVGRMWSAHALWTILPHHVGENTGMLESAGYIAGSTPADSNILHRVGNAMTYISPNMEGFQVAASILADNNGDGEDLDAYNLAAKFAVGDFTIAASHVGVETAADADVTALSVAYKADALHLSARYMQNDANGANDDQYSATAAYTMENTTLIAGYANDDSWTEEDAYNFEVQQKLGKQARAYVAYVQERNGYDGVEAGYRVDF
jgi:predicted porin